MGHPVYIFNIYIISFKFERNFSYFRKFSKNKKRTIFFTGQARVIKESLNKEINGISDIVGQTVWTTKRKCLTSLSLKKNEFMGDKIKLLMTVLSLQYFRGLSSNLKPTKERSCILEKYVILKVFNPF